MAPPAIVLRWIKTVCCFVDMSGCFQQRGLGCNGFKGVRLAPQTQEGSTVRGVKAGHSQTLTFNSVLCFKVDPSTLMDRMSGQKHAGTI